MRCSSLDEAIAIGNDVAYGLSASIYTRDINKASRRCAICTRGSST
jgi:aldehyde dehydrogenase (NAD+)